MFSDFSTIPFKSAYYLTEWMEGVGFPVQWATEVRLFTLFKQKYLELMTYYLAAIKLNFLYGVNTL